MKLQTKILLFLSFLTSACATKYGKEGLFSNGYSDRFLERDTFVVTFEANEYTTPEKVQKYALRRASEVTLKNGYKYFLILEQFDEENPLKGYPKLAYPSLRLKIKCFKQPPSHPNVYQA